MAKILVIDDDGIIRDALENFLSRRGHHVLTASDGANGFLMFKNHGPDIVILDRELPLITGSQVLKKIRELSASIPVIILTGFDSPEDAVKYKELGASVFLSKGTGLGPLMESIDALLDAMPGQTAQSQRADSPATQNHETAGAKGKIIVADDDESIRSLLTRFLKKRGYCVITATNGTEAVEAVGRENPDMVLLDINMPKKNGLDALKELKALHPQVAVIMITGNEDMELAKECLRSGASDYIAKPFNFDYLETSVMAKIFLQM